jgi:hypothetical protein
MPTMSVIAHVIKESTPSTLSRVGSTPPCTEKHSRNA